MRTLFLVLALCLPALAQAQAEQNYKSSGFVVNGPSLTGSVTVDSATGTIISAYVQSYRPRLYKTKDVHV